MFSLHTDIVKPEPPRHRTRVRDVLHGRWICQRFLLPPSVRTNEHYGVDLSEPSTPGRRMQDRRNLTSDQPRACTSEGARADSPIVRTTTAYGAAPARSCSPRCEGCGTPSSLPSTPTMLSQQTMHPSAKGPGRERPPVRTWWRSSFLLRRCFVQTARHAALAATEKVASG